MKTEKSRLASVLLLIILTTAFLACSNSASSENEPEMNTIEKRESDEIPELNIDGIWEGTLMAGAQKLTIRIVLENSLDPSAITANISVPEQGLLNHPAESVKIDKVSNLTVVFDMFKAEFSGTFTGMTIKGTWKQGGSSLPLVLEKQEISIEDANKRMQDPVPPFPYTEKNFIVPGKSDKIHHGVTLTIPEGDGPFPAVILVNGSGQQDRNSEIYNHRPFLVLADALAREGIAVLRYDDRGVGESVGDTGQVTTFDFADDASLLIDWLRERDEVTISSMGIIGHSEGGLIASILTAERDDIDWTVLLAAPGVSGRDISLAQSEAIMRASHMSNQQIETTKAANTAIYDLATGTLPEADKAAKIKKELTRIGVPAAQANEQIKSILLPWTVTWMKTDPVIYLSRIHTPILALNGSLDLQVLANQNLPAIKAAAVEAGNDNVTVMVRDGLNHLFQPAVTGLVSEYGSIETTFDPETIDLIIEWIKAL